MKNLGVTDRLMLTFNKMTKTNLVDSIISVPIRYKNQCLLCLKNDAHNY